MLSCLVPGPSIKVWLQVMPHITASSVAHQSRKGRNDGWMWRPGTVIDWRLLSPMRKDTVDDFHLPVDHAHPSSAGPRGFCIRSNYPFKKKKTACNFSASILRLQCRICGPKLSASRGFAAHRSLRTRYVWGLNAWTANADRCRSVIPSANNADSQQGTQTIECQAVRTIICHFQVME